MQTYKIKFHEITSFSWIPKVHLFFAALMPGSGRTFVFIVPFSFTETFSGSPCPWQNPRFSGLILQSTTQCIVRKQLRMVSRALGSWESWLLTSCAWADLEVSLSCKTAELDF